jgi:heptosyltransferase I
VEPLAPMSAPKLDRVGIVMLSTAGGAVWTLPVVNAIKRAHPAAKIAWIAQPGTASLIEGHPAVDEIIPFQRDRGVVGYLELRKRLAIHPFDTLLVLQSYLKSGVVAGMARADVKIGVDRARARDLGWLFTNRELAKQPMRHMQDQFLEFLQPLGLAAEPVEYRLRAGEPERAWQRQLFMELERPAVPLVIGTTKPEKDWLPERWAALADALWHDFGLEPLLVGGQSERELATERVIQSLGKRKPRSALGSGLRRLLAILEGSALVISPDTGPIHMAVAVDRPVIGLYGHTNPKRTGPYRYQDLLVDAFGDSGEIYDASAPSRSGRMSRIQVRDVLDRVERWRASYASSAPKG